nr:putative ORF1 [Picobirnavirus sp.]
MTQNQIAYFKAKQEQLHWERSDKENIRHNYMTEQLTQQSNLFTKEHYERSDSETARHNVAAEDISRTEAETHRLNLYETVRHNQQSEQLGWANFGETVRHNRASENIGYANVQVGMANVGATLAGIEESIRHNQASERQGWTKIGYERDYNKARTKEIQIQNEANVVNDNAIRQQNAKTETAEQEAKYKGKRELLGMIEQGATIYKTISNIIPWNVIGSL